MQRDITGKVFDYQMTYRGMTPVANSKDKMNIEVGRGRSNYIAQPRFYFSQYNNSAMAEPDVQSCLFYDLYISPLQRNPASEQTAKSQSLLLTKGERKPLGDFEVHFEGFEMNNHGENGSSVPAPA